MVSLARGGFALEMHDKALSRNLILVDGVNQPTAAR
jgi:hypothetical protein